MSAPRLGSSQWEVEMSGEECMPIVLGPGGELVALSIPAPVSLRGSLGNTGSWVISNQLLWGKGQPLLGSIVSI